MIKIKPIIKGKIRFKPLIENQEINVQPATKVINENYTKSEVDEMIADATQQYIDIFEDNISGVFEFPENITHIAYFGFCGHKNITKIICHNNMTFDASGSNFRYNNKLTDFVFPNNENFTAVPQYCFANNIAITTLDGFIFPTPIKTLGNYCFSSITSLKYAHLPSNIETINQYCFNADGELLEASGEGVKTLGANAFVNCKKLHTVNFPNVEDLQGYVFNVCNALTEVEFSKLKTIATNAFRGSKITHFTMPSSLTTTTLDSTFYAVNTLKWVDIAPSINRLNNNVFINCTALDYVIVRNPVPPVLASTAFRGVKKNGIIYVPKGSKTAYENSVWNNSTANYYPKQAGWTIQELDEDGNIPS